MSNAKDDNVVQALAQVARLGGFTLKSVATSDDLKERSLTVKLTRVSDGWVQDTLPYEREDLTYRVNGHGEVMDLQKTQLQPGDRAETGADADAEIAAAAEADPDDTDPDRIPEPAELGEEPPPDIHLVGEAAAAARPRRRS